MPEVFAARIFVASSADPARRLIRLLCADGALPGNDIIRIWHDYLSNSICILAHPVRLGHVHDTGRILLYNLHYDHEHNTVAHDNQDKRWSIFRITEKAEIDVVMGSCCADNRMRKEQHSPCRMTDRGWNGKRSERAVSRVLSPRFPGAVSIYLGR